MNGWKQEIMIIEWFSVSTFDWFFCFPRRVISLDHHESPSRRMRLARKWLIYVSLHKSWIIILLYGLSRSGADPFPSTSDSGQIEGGNGEISYASILLLLLLALFSGVVDPILFTKKSNNEFRTSSTEITYATFGKTKFSKTPLNSTLFRSL